MRIPAIRFASGRAPFDPLGFTSCSHLKARGATGLGMISYKYEARRANGETVRGDMDAASTAALADALSRKGLLLETAKPRSGGLRRKAHKAPPLISLLTFVREFRHLVSAGLPITQALSFLQDRGGDKVMEDAVTSLRAGVENGLPLDEAAAARPDVFDRLVQASLGAGLRAGRMAEALERLERFLALRAALSRKIRNAMAYPLFLLALLIVVLAILMLFVLPRFAELYSEFGAELPPATRLLIVGVEWAPIWVSALIALVLITPFAWRRIMQSRSARRWRDRRILAVPMVGRIASDIQVIQFCNVTGMLLRAGTPLHEALGFAADSAENEVARDALLSAAADVRSGRALSDGLATTGFLPPIAQSMIRAGEASGALDELLDAIAALHEQTVEDRMARLLAMVEPGMMMLVGLILGAVIITVYLPIFGISGVVQ